MKGVRRFRDRLKEDMKNPEFRKAFEEEETFVSLAIQIAKLREKKRLTQGQLAKRVPTTQQTVSRLENTDNKSCSIGTLIKVAGALDKRVKVELV